MRAGGLTTSDIAFLKGRRERFRGAVNLAYVKAFADPEPLQGCRRFPASLPPAGAGDGIGCLRADPVCSAHNLAHKGVGIPTSQVRVALERHSSPGLARSGEGPALYAVNDQINDPAKVLIRSFQFPTPKFAEPRPVINQ